MGTLKRRRVVIADRLDNVQAKLPPREAVLGLLDSRGPALTPEDRLLLDLYFREGRGLEELALLQQVRPRRMRHRLERLVTRLASPAFGFILSSAVRWPASRQRVAEACFLKGLSQRQAAKALRLTIYGVRCHYVAILHALEARGLAA